MAGIKTEQRIVFAGNPGLASREHTAGLISMFAALQGGWKVLCASRSGVLMKDMFRFLEVDALTLHPDKLVIAPSQADLVIARTGVSELASTLKNTVKEVAQLLPDCEIFVASYLPFAQDPEYSLNKKGIEAFDAFRQVFKNSKVVLCDLLGYLLQCAERIEPVPVTTDGVQLTEHGRLLASLYVANCLCLDTPAADRKYEPDESE
ncbi:MAG: hypothetical protein U5N86_09670 [Planctomycetota bacterium]|nr:hypothetical protein [Planctomycetota bacterium]